MDCDKFEDFWVSWSNGVRVGRGIYVGTNEFLTYETKLYDVQTISLSTYDEVEGYWKWPTQYGRYIAIIKKHTCSLTAES